MTPTIRKATRLDSRQMADLLNRIIKEGGTTALVRPVTADDIQEWRMRDPERSTWQVAVLDDGEIVGFQWVEPAEYLPKDAAEIATFVKVGQTGLGIGSALFQATQKAAKKLGYRWINANIRSDNEGGLIYYQSRGFRDYDRWEDYKLESGEIVNKVLKRFDLY
ncbi:MAG: N-acetyltransferase family protein [Paracoccaceae bacterium]